MTIRSLFRAEPYWYIIILFWLVTGGVYIAHLVSGWMPDRVIINLPLFGTDFPVYWYGVVIMAGVTLGAYVASRLAYNRALTIFVATVPAHIRDKGLTALALPGDIRTALAQNNITTLGHLLLLWGFNPDLLGLKRGGVKTVREALAAANLDPLWIGDDSPWRQWNPDYVWGGVGVCLVLGVIGARLYHVMTPSPSMAAIGITSPLDYFRNPMQLINIRNGGLGIYGGIIGGVLGLFWYTRRHRLPLLAWADLAAIGLTLGQMMGRWGNFFNQELYGSPTNLPWAVTINPNNRLPAYADVEQFHPAFLYESLWSLMTFLVLYALAKRYTSKIQPGELTALYLIFYGVGRTLLEIVRLDSRTVSLGGVDIHLPVATLISLVIAVVMGIWLIVRRRNVHFKA
ncbi:MAG: prolipoprotein diacylglyceryl transferase [Chloroflexi bacterium]|nr:prolipoprotein diacylglyceryl transferase [Chloroflexota bacterium]MBP8056601.1 prolipoprotein diacylglyceryl transferase [Chloroflexota bacterium]